MGPAPFIHGAEQAHTGVEGVLCQHAPTPFFTVYDSGDLSEIIVERDGIRVH
jgi:hypothetical protein